VYGFPPLWPKKRAIIADASHESRRLAHLLLDYAGWNLPIVKRRQRAVRIAGLIRIVERTFAWLARNRRFSKDYEYNVQTSGTLIGTAATRFTSRVTTFPATP
jgi:transposase